MCIRDSSYYEYDVSGKVSMKAMYERGKIGEEDLRRFLTAFQMAVREAEVYLLDVHRILLKPEYIFFEEGRFYFCYYPPARQDLWEEFHRLTEYFVKEADYQDKEAVRMIDVYKRQHHRRRGPFGGSDRYAAGNEYRT